MTDALPGDGPLAGGTGTVPPAAGARPAGPRRPGRGRARLTWKTAFFVLAVVAIVVGAAWALLGNRLFVVRSITVTGEHLVTQAQVLDAADVSLGTPLSSVNPGAVSKRVEKIRQVESVTVTEDWPDHLVIAVTERVPVVAVRMAAGGYDLIDPSGILVQHVADRPTTLPLLSTTLQESQWPGAPSISAVATVLGELTPSLADQVTTVSVSAELAGSGSSAVDSQQVTLGLRDGKTVVWGDTSDAAAKNEEVKILLPQAGHSVNVSDPNTVVTG